MHSTPPLRGSRQNIAMKFGMKKTRMVCPPDGENILTILLLFFDRIHERDRQTNKRTLHDGIGRAYAQHRAAKTTRRDLSHPHADQSDSVINVIK